MATLSDVRAELTAAGFGPRGAVHVFAKFFLLLAIAVALLVAACVVEAWPAKIALVAAGAWFQVAASMCGHDGSHKAVSKKEWVNEALAWLAFTTVGGLSNYYWREKHNLKHHPFCNMSKKDPDVTQFPFALSREQHARANWFTRPLQSMQAWVFLPICFLFMATALRFSSALASLRGIVHGPSRAYAAADTGFLLLHASLYVVPCFLGVPPLTMLFLYVGVAMFSGLYLTAIFAPAHMTAPLVAQSFDPLRLQLETTRNFRTNWFFRWTLIGLDSQIEHHLFPKAPHVDLPRMRPIVKAFCEKNGLTYTEAGWFRSLVDTHLHFARAIDLAEIVVGDPPLAKEKPAPVSAASAAA